MFEGYEHRYKQKNIERYKAQLWPFTAAQNSNLASEIIRLCTLIRPQYRSQFPEVEWLKSESNKRILQTSTSSLESITKEIQNLKLFGVHHLPAFIAADLLLTSYDPNKFDQYKALTLLCVTRLAFIGTHKAKIKAICDDMRLFSVGSREQLAAHMPDIHQLNFETLVQQFQFLVGEDNPSPPTSTVVNQLNHYRRPYESTLGHKEGYSRKSTTTHFNKQHQLDSSEAKYLDDDEATSIIEVTQISNQSGKSKQHWHREDHASDAQRSINVVKIQQPLNKDYAVTAIHARAIVSRIQKNEMSLACDIRGLTKYEAGVLLRQCVAEIGGESVTRFSAKAILIMLLTGNSFEQTQKLKSKHSNKRIVGFQRNHKLPSQTQRTEIEALFPSVDTKLWLPLPDTVCEGLTSFTFKMIKKKDVQAFIEHLNKRHRTHITLTKISQYLQNVFTHEGIDSIYEALIRGTAIQDTPALFYTGLNHVQLMRYYQRYLKYLSRLLNNECLMQFSLTPDNRQHGSRVHFDQALLKQLFHALKSNIQTLISRRAKHHPDVHNQITLYTQLVLGIASGYRPVSGWFGKLEHINLQRGDYWISDKESGFGDNSRVVILPNEAILVLQGYITYCSQMAIHNGNTQCDLSVRYQRVLDSSEHLFFYIDENSITECTPSAYARHIDPVFPVQPNWARHHIRTLLLKKEMNPALVSAWMGHQYLGKRALHQHSSLTRTHLELVTDTISQHLKELNVEMTQW